MGEWYVSSTFSLGHPLLITHALLYVYLKIPN
jgi:hypothetical protein